MKKSERERGGRDEEKNIRELKREGEQEKERDGKKNK